MTADQWITAGIPLAAVLLGILRNEFALNSVERHVFSRVDSFEKAMDAKFEAQHQGFLGLETHLEEREH